MKKLHFTYHMQIDYSEEVAKCNFTIKCIPKDTNRQKIENTKISLEPDTACCIGVDGLQNQKIYGANEEPHTSFSFRIEGDAVTGLCDYEEAAEESQAMIFKTPHGLNQAGESIRTFFSEIDLQNKITPYEKAKQCMQVLSGRFAYRTGTTNVDTSAEEAFFQGYGVCQDYAHILIALLHLAGVTARYVTGFIIGEGQSHAWVEVLDQNRWYGIDPTHNRDINDDYIKIGVGRDARDCTINRGIMHGGGLHTQTIRVCVTESGKA